MQVITEEEIDKLLAPWDAGYNDLCTHSGKIAIKKLAEIDYIIVKRDSVVSRRRPDGTY